MKMSKAKNENQKKKSQQNPLETVTARSRTMRGSPTFLPADLLTNMAHIKKIAVWKRLYVLESFSLSESLKEHEC